VSLFAELFHEMLQYEFGMTILDALKRYTPEEKVKKRRQTSPERKTEKTEKAEKVSSELEKQTEISSKEPAPQPTKETATEETPEGEDLNEPPKETVEIKEEPQPIPEPPPKQKDEVQNQLNQILPAQKQLLTDSLFEKKNEQIKSAQLLKAFQFFDKNCTGFIRYDDFESLLHNLGQNMSKGHVRALLSKVVESGAKKVFYKKMIEVLE
jgi:hypothetical protein